MSIEKLWDYMNLSDRRIFLLGKASAYSEVSKYIVGKGMTLNATDVSDAVKGMSDANASRSDALEEPE